MDSDTRGRPTSIDFFKIVKRIEFRPELKRDIKLNFKKIV